MFHIHMVNDTRDVNYVIAGFETEEAAQEYITNLQDTYPAFCALGEFIVYRASTPEGFMDVAEFAEEDILKS